MLTKKSRDMIESEVGLLDVRNPIPQMQEGGLGGEGGFKRYFSRAHE